MKLLLRNRQAPGDVLMLTAAVRDLHRAHPGEYRTAVDTTCRELWENNPFVTVPFTGWEPDRVIDCQYPLVHDANRRPFHFIHGFVQDLERKLGVTIPIGPFRGDVYLSDAERHAPSPVAEAGHDGAYWVMVAGGKHDFTAKWWDPESYQAVVDHFAGKIRFVQCGGRDDWHPPLRGVVNLVGKTDVRELIRVIYHADGVVCPVTFAMHLAAAVPPRPGAPPLRPCVVIAGGREPAHWEMSPGHQFLHTVGALDCCAAGGCWKSRCQPVGDGESRDSDLCVKPVTVRGGVQVGKCMTMITPAKVIDAIELYYQGGALKYPATEPAVPAVKVRNDSPSRDGVAVTIGVAHYAEMAALAARELSERTGLRTVVIGDREFANSGLEEPAFLKFRLFDLVDAENILFFDADMVCLEGWDPAQYFGSRAIACVRERMVPVVLRESPLWGVPPEEHFNTGLFIASRRHHAAWLRRAEGMRHERPTALYDQLPLNGARRELGIPLKLLDRRHNWIGFGSSSLSHDVPVYMAHRLAPDRQHLNVEYFKGRYQLFEPKLVADEDSTARLRGRSSALHDGGGGRRVLFFRDDGTLLPPAPPEQEGYWFVHTVRGRPTLALASERQILRQFVRVLSGAWVATEAGTADPARDGPRLIEQTEGARAVSNAPAITEETARAAADEFIRHIPPYPTGRFRGRGIVVCGGGEKYFPCAWVCVRMLRHVGCDLPVELWHAGDAELPDRWREMIEPYGVKCVDAEGVRRRHPVRRLSGWEMKPFALLHCSFEEVMFVDADNVAVRDPAYLFDSRPFHRHGAVFWPDFERLAPERAIWRVCGVPYRDEPEVESGQILLDKRRCWGPLQLTMHLNEHSDFYYHYVHGDKETFHMAWRMLGRDYAMVPHPIRPLEGTMCQHDFRGRRLFQHRNLAKWTVRGENAKVRGFRYEDVCLRFLGELINAGRQPASQLPLPHGVAGAVAGVDDGSVVQPCNAH